MCFPNFSLTWAKEPTVDVFVLCQNPSLRSPDRLAFASQKDWKMARKTGHVGPCSASTSASSASSWKAANCKARYTEPSWAKLSRAEPSKQKTTRRSSRLGWRMLKNAEDLYNFCITRNSNREALATIWLGASIHRFTRGQAFDWKVQGIVKGSWSYMLLSRVKILLKNTI